MHLVLAHQKSSIINNIQYQRSNAESDIGESILRTKNHATIKVDKKQIHLGTAGSQEAAARLYDRFLFET
ncbi:hypothetical protein CsSME_00019427 [Camellia sinensis var. sinensis]